MISGPRCEGAVTRVFEGTLPRECDSSFVKRSAQWALCAGILFVASIAVTVSGIFLGLGGGLLTIIFLLMGVGALLAANRFRKLEATAPGPTGGSTEASELPARSPEIRHDRAFNRIAMARREAELLASSGVDITSAQDLIAQAQGAFDNRDFDRAYVSAQSAHELLVAARRPRPLPSVR